MNCSVPCEGCVDYIVNPELPWFLMTLSCKVIFSGHVASLLEGECVG